jgi:two-component system response regulator AdeR
MTMVDGLAQADCPTVLIAEDDSELADELVAYAKQLGFRPLHAANGSLALELAQSERPAAILLDITLPGMDGRDVFARLKDAGLLEETVVIFTTGRGSQLDRLTGLKLGADAYETKPYDLDMLFRKVRRQIEKKRVSRSERAG